jgi:hypothetical protein
MPAPDQSQGQYVHGIPVTAAPVHGAKVPTHGSPPVVTTPPSGAPEPAGV